MSQRVRIDEYHRVIIQHDEKAWCPTCQRETTVKELKEYFGECQQCCERDEDKQE